ncbi:hypothetical protein CJP74_03430 [Psittacicella melopsittaci]|uniref:Surface protein n=1 Tax=Psittacicella melopsittaci TaxID=2028576 RepID=A0A3A1Y3C0_9GAMM|nr:BspA family leucine-rich repeat surface protein [Psittacicella melopsittaci]RIY32832.1 hypothetical protein CJP74_03430 [Psittacicella melopsittaci]
MKDLFSRLQDIATDVVNKVQKMANTVAHNFTDISYQQLPPELQPQRLHPRQVRITFTSLSKLKRFLDVYIAKFNTPQGQALDLSFIDMSQITSIDLLFAKKELIVKKENPQGIVFYDYNARQAQPLNIDFNTLDLSNVKSMQGTFMGVEIINDISNLKVDNVENMSYLFSKAVFKNPKIDLSKWNVSRVKNMSFMFRGARLNAQQNLQQWNVAQVTNMQGMFYQASNLAGLKIDNWQVGKVTNMSAMFLGATDFNGNLSQWNVSQVTNMQHMFRSATLFNCDLDKWDVSRVTNMSAMFCAAKSFNGDISTWDVRQVTDMSGMFYNATSFTGDLTAWNAVRITNNKDMFTGADNFKRAHKERTKYQGSKFTDISFAQLPPELQKQRINPRQITITFTTTEKLKEFLDVYIAKFNDNTGKPLDLGFLDMRHIVNINYLFANLGYRQHLESGLQTIVKEAKLTKVPLNIDFATLDLSNVYYMDGAFAGTIIYSDLSSLDVSNIRSMSALFYEAEILNPQTNLGRWDVSKVCYMNFMFTRVKCMHQLNLNHWNVSNVCQMNFMFAGSIYFNEDLNNWDVSHVNSMAGMFWGAILFNGNIGNWNVSKVISMENMFAIATNFKQNLSHWNTCRVTNYTNIFSYATNMPTTFMPRFVKEVYENPLYNLLPAKYQGRKIQPGEIICRFTNLAFLKVFLDSYINNCHSLQGAPLDLSFIDMAQIEIADFLFVEQEVINSFSLNQEGVFLNDPVVPKTRPLNVDFNSLDFSNVKSMNGTFLGVELYGDISKLKVFNVIRMSNTFRKAIFRNSYIDLSKWNVYQVGDLSFMFYFAQLNGYKNFNTWGLKGANNLYATFSGAKNLAGLNISDWDVSNVMFMAGMFTDATDFNGDLSRWNTSSLILAQYMFANCTSFNSDLSKWNVSNVVDMSGMFLCASSFNQNIGNWDVSNVINMNQMFRGASSFNQDLRKWNVSQVTDMSQMFWHASSFKPNIKNWNVKNVTEYDNFIFTLDNNDLDNIPIKFIGRLRA